MERRPKFQRNVKLEALLQRLNDLLGPIEDAVLDDYSMPKYPVMLIVGCARSGSTLLMQWLARSGCFAYPTNLLSRFYGAPYIGALIQQLLTNPDYDFKRELHDFSGEFSFESELGKTRGGLAPNEFWYFWRRFFPIAEPMHMAEELLEKVQTAKFAAELAAIESVFDKPLAMKGMILEFNIPFLSSILDKALFLHIERHPFYNIQSLLESRVKFFGERNAWYSIKPPEYAWLKDLDPIQQVCGQVYFTVRAVKEGLDQIDASRGLVVDYEEFCAAPERIFQGIVDKFAQQGYDVQWEYTGPARFEHTNQVRLSQEDCDRILQAYQRFSGESLIL